VTDDLAAWKAAGAAHVRYNAPLGHARARMLVESLRARAPSRLVDLGCGRGAFLLDVLESVPAAAGVGVDVDPSAVATARAAAAQRALAGRATFDVADAACWGGAADTVSCIGSTHPLGGAAGLVTRSESLGAVTVLAGDAVWQREPSPWCLEHLGPLPAGLDAFAAPFHAAGWSVVQRDLSGQDEWDDFEGGWSSGVRSVGTAGAIAFAAEREEQYRRRYRGVLGFAWVLAVRPVRQGLPR
jgi:SAM-dependent methyltransferase